MQIVGIKLGIPFLFTATDLDNNNLKIAADFQGSDITEYLTDAWVKSRKDRLEILVNGTTTAEYIKRFPVLKNQNIAVKLVSNIN